MATHAAAARAAVAGWSMRCIVALAWNATYLFRLGFERWIRARPDYDHWVLLGVVVVYVVAFWLLKVPKGMWRFSGFGEVWRLVGACAVRRRRVRRCGDGGGSERRAACGAGAASGDHADGAGAGAHGLSHVVRARAAAHHRQRCRDPARAGARGRRGGSPAGGRHPPQGWIVLGLARRRPAQARRAHRRRAGAGAARVRCATRPRSARRPI